MITVKEVTDALQAEIVNLSDPLREVTGGYCGDFLSNVMGKASKNCVWFTVMTNINVCAVASLADVSLVVICEDSVTDAEFAGRAAKENINVVRVKCDVFSAVLRLCNEIKI